MPQCIFETFFSAAFVVTDRKQRTKFATDKIRIGSRKKIQKGDWKMNKSFLFVLCRCYVLPQVFNYWVILIKRFSIYWYYNIYVNHMMMCFFAYFPWIQLIFFHIHVYSLVKYILYLRIRKPLMSGGWRKSLMSAHERLIKKS